MKNFGMNINNLYLSLKSVRQYKEKNQWIDKELWLLRIQKSQLLYQFGIHKKIIATVFS